MNIRILVTKWLLKLVYDDDCFAMSNGIAALSALSSDGDLRYVSSVCWLFKFIFIH